MHSGESSSSGSRLTAQTGLSRADANDDASARIGADPALGPRRRFPPTWQVATWACAAIALLAFFVKISYGERIDADGANIALQGWDFIHGHTVMHGWLPGDATYYGFEVPILGVAELVFGLGARAAHVAS